MGSITKFLIDSDVDTIGAVQSGTWNIATVTTLTGITNDVNIADGGNSITVDATDLDIRDLSSATDSIAAVQSGTWDIGTVTTLTGITNDVNIADGGNSITVDGSDFDIRDLTHVSDSVKIGDGTDFLAVNADGSINVLGSLSIDDRQNTANLAQNLAISVTAVALPTTPLANRERIIIQNLGPNAVELGSAAVAYGAGLNLPKGDSIELWAGPANAIYAICNTAQSANVRILELS